MTDRESKREIPFARPLLGDAERAAAQRVLSGHVLTHGPEGRAFEAAFAEFVGARHAVATSSCTTALHLALVAAGVGPGDEVIVPAMTHVATAHAVEHCGATPVFADVSAETGGLDPAALRAALTPRSRAVMPVHYIGLPCAMDEIGAVAAARGLAVIEDAAAALGGRFGGRQAGTIGTAGAYSFYPTKLMTTLEGGMLVTDDDALAEAARKKRAFSYDKGLGERAMPGLYDIEDLGWNYRMNEVQAAIGLCQLTRLPDFLARRRANAERLHAALAGLPGVTLFPLRHGAAESCCFCVNLTLPRDGSVSRDALMRHLQARGIGFSVHYPVALPFSRYHAARNHPAAEAFPVARWIAAQTLSLPCGPHLGADDMDAIAAAVADFFQEG